MATKRTVVAEAEVDVVATEDATPAKASDVPDVFTYYQRQFHEAMEESSGLLRKAIADQQSIYDKLNQSILAQIQPNLPPASDAAPNLVDSVAKAYQRATELYEGADTSAAAVARAETGVPPLIESEKAAGESAQRALEVTAQRIKEATEYLNAAMVSVVQATHSSTSEPVVKKKPRTAKAHRKK